MTTDTPDSVNTAAAFLQGLTLLPDVFRVGTINDLNSTAQMLTRYAASLERTCEWVYVGDDCHKPKCCGALSSTLCETVAGYMKFCNYCGARIVEVRE